MNLSEVAIDHETTISWSDSTPNVSREAVYSELGERAGQCVGPFLLFSTQVETLAI